MEALKKREYAFREKGSSDVKILSCNRPVMINKNVDKNKILKNELMDVFQKFGYLNGGKDYEINIRTTSGNVAWININSIETIK